MDCGAIVVRDTSGRFDWGRCVDTIESLNRNALAIYHRWGRDERRAGWAELWDRDQDRYLIEKRDWFTAHREKVAAWLG